MTPRDVASWVLLKIQESHRGIEIHAYDSEGRYFPPQQRVDWPSSIPARSGSRLPLVHEISALWLPRDWTPGAVTVFVSPSPSLASLDWDRVVRTLLARHWKLQIPVARYVRPATAYREPFQLPVKVITLGQAGAALRSFRRENWVEKALALEGLEIGQVGRYSELTETLAEGNVDVVICEDHRVKDVMEMCKGVSLSSRPQLLVTWPTGEERTRSLEVPSGTVVYQTAPAGEITMARWVNTCLNELIHGRPLATLPEKTSLASRVYCGPDTLHPGRFLQPADQLQTEAAELEGLTKALKLVGSQSVEMDDILARVERVTNLPNFRELRRIIPASRARYGIQGSIKEVEALLPQELSEEAKQQLISNQQRRVDIGLRPLGPKTGEMTFLAESTPLQLGAEYVLFLRIGQPFPKSLLSSDPPPVDPLVPQRRGGTWLHVAIFPKNVSIKGRRVRRLHLPDLGPSTTVGFRLQLPMTWEVLEARIGIYHRNQLLQSYRLVIDKQGARAELDFSQTERFLNIEAFGKRAVSLGVNHDQNGTHQLTLFRGGKQKSYAFPEGVMEEANLLFRQFLGTVTGDDPYRPRFDTYPNEKEPIQAAFFDLAKDAAILGEKLYAVLEKHAKDLEKELEFLRDAVDEPVQIVRLDPNFVFPWTILYDWDLPQDSNGHPDRQAEFCLGTMAGKPCEHRKDSGVYCINGFWGLRLILEEMIGGSSERVDSVRAQPAIRRKGAVLLSADQDAPDLNKLADDLQEKLVKLSPEESLLDAVWSLDRRPSVTIIYGHTNSGEHLDPEITLPGNRSLSTLAVRTRRRKTQLEDPRPVVFLLACETALINVRTLTDFVSEFHLARAAVILGTEVVAFRSLLARFGREITLALWQEKKLGEAIRDFRRKMMVAGNPTPFVFHAVGNTDFQFQWKEENP